MGLLSSSVSITRYHVKGEISGPTIETVRSGLKQFAISKLDDEEAVDKISGWASLEQPYQTDFDKDTWLFGSYFVFSLRIDKKNISARIVKKHVTREINKRLAESKREYLSKNEKKTVKEDVLLMLAKRIPSTPNVYDVVWDYEKKTLWFFSNLKAANEELETLFTKAFNLHLIRLFPYTTAVCGGTGIPEEKVDQLDGLSATFFTE
ncbi:MAG: recombination-associated protein RdgC [Thermodesulfobacteriota bacterium]